MKDVFVVYAVLLLILDICLIDIDLIARMILYAAGELVVHGEFALELRDLKQRRKRQKTALVKGLFVVYAVILYTPTRYLY